MERSIYHKYMYTLAAIWNWILAVSFLILPRIDMAFFSLAGPIEAPPSLLWFDSLFGIVFIIGLGCYFISRNITDNHDLIKVCICEKMWVFIIGIAYFLIEHASILVVLVVSGDFLFGLLFLEDLRVISKLSN